MPKEISIGSVAMPLMESVENPFAEPVLYAISNNRDITEAIINTQLNNMSLRVQQAMEYAKNYYSLALPQGKHGNTTMVDDATLASIIATDLGIGNGVVVDYNLVDDMTLELAILPLLQGRRNYNFNLNRIYNYPPGMTVPDGASVSISAVTPNTNNTDIDVIYHIYRAASAGPPPITEYDEYSTETFTPIEDIKYGRLYYLVKYYEKDGLGEPITGVYNYWYYDATSGKYPALDPIKDDAEDNTFMPVIPIRYENVTLNSASHKTTELYKTSYQLMQKLGLGFETVCGFVNSNPDLADIDHAFVTFGVDLQEDKNACNYYLAEFFDYLAALSYADRYNFIDKLQQANALSTNTYDFTQGIGSSDSSSTYSETGINVAMVNNPQEISLIEHGLDIKIKYRYITTTVKHGVIGDVGTATKTMVPSYTGVKQSTFGYYELDFSELILKVQITPETYKEVVVVGLVHLNQIAGKTHRTTLGDILTDPNNHNLLIPVHFGVSKRVPMPERTKMYEAAFQLVINSYVVTKLDWYETQEFKLVIFVVAVVLAVWTAGKSLIAAKAAFVSAGGTAALGTAVIAALWSLVINLALPAILTNIIMDALVNMVGGELAFILSIVVAIVGISRGDASKISFLNYSIPTAQMCLTASSALLDATSRYYKEAIGEVQEEYARFVSEAEKQQKELDDITKLLDTRSMFDPLSIIEQPRLISINNEIPDSLYNRTIHNKNIGVTTLDVIGNYHEMLLQLPKLTLT